MAFCKKCSAPLKDGDKICPECRTPVKKFDFEKILKYVMNTQDYTNAYSPRDIAENRLFAVLCYIPFVCLYPLIAKARKSAFVKFHANQGMLIFAVHLLSAVISAFIVLLYGIPLLGILICILSGIVFGAVELINVVLMIYGIINAALGRAKELPLIGRIRLF